MATRANSHKVTTFTDKPSGRFSTLGSKIALVLIIAGILVLAFVAYDYFKPATPFRYEPKAGQDKLDTAYEKKYTGGDKAAIDYLKGQIANATSDTDKYRLYIQLSSYYASSNQQQESVDAMKAAYKIGGVADTRVGIILGYYYEQQGDKKTALQYFTAVKQQLEKLPTESPERDVLAQINTKITELQK